MPNKRRYSTFSLAEEYGLVNSNRQKKQTARSHSQYQDLGQFANGPIQFKLPREYGDLIVLAETMMRIHHDMYNLKKPEDFATELCNLRRSLLILFISDSVYITEKFVVELPNATIDRYRIDTELFVTISHVTLKLISGEFAEVTCEQEFPYIVSNHLVSGNILNKPVMKFTVAEIVESLFLIGEKWHALKYSTELTLFLELLHSRIAQLHFTACPATEATRNEQHEIQNEDGTFSIKLRVMEDIGWVFRDMFKKIYIHNYVCRSRAAALPKFTKHDRDLLYKRVIDADSNDDLQNPFMMFYLRYITMPGELHAFERDKPHKDPRPDRVLKFRWGSVDRVHWITERLAEPLRTIIEKRYFADSVTDIALLFLIDVYASNILGASFSERFVIFYDWLQKVSQDLETQLNEKHFPVILQSFNWIGIYYNSQYYEHQNVLDAFLHWMKIACGPPWNMSIDGLRMETFDMYQFDFYHS